MSAPAHKFKVADISLAAFGRRLVITPKGLLMDDS